jgi:hypothetical protein
MQPTIRETAPLSIRGRLRLWHRLAPSDMA